MEKNILLEILIKMYGSREAAIKELEKTAWESPMAKRLLTIIKNEPDQDEWLGAD